MHFRAGGTGRKHVQNHYQPRRNRVALMEGRPFFAWKYILRSFSAAAFFIYTPPRREHVNARPLTPLLLLLDLHGSKHETRQPPSALHPCSRVADSNARVLSLAFQISLSSVADRGCDNWIFIIIIFDFSSYSKGENPLCTPIDRGILSDEWRKRKKNNSFSDLYN